MNKRILFVILFGLVLNTFAQEKPKAIKIAEFDDRTESVSAFTRRVKRVFKELDSRPTGTRIFIAITQRNFELPQNLLDIADKIVAKLPPEKRKLITVADSFCLYDMKRDNSEFWILPKGADSPYPRPRICDYECSTIEIQGKPYFQEKRETLKFIVNVSGIKPSSYNWTVVGGHLLSGQNSSSISVRIKKSARINNGDAVTVTVKILNIPARTMCPDSVSFTSVLQPNPVFD